MHSNYDEGQLLSMKGGQRRASCRAENLAENAEIAVRSVGSQQCGISTWMQRMGIWPSRIMCTSFRREWK
jgi:hypothetical protein